MAETIADTVVLCPGEIWFGQGPAYIRTLLGSCVGITLWHPQRHLGGMCHYLLSGQTEHERHSDRPGYYATGAIRYFRHQISKWQARPRDFEVKIFGGSNMFPSVERRTNTINVAQSNIEHGQDLLQKADFSITARDVGGICYRTIILELGSGDVWVRYGRNSRPAFGAGDP